MSGPYEIVQINSSRKIITISIHLSVSFSFIVFTISVVPCLPPLNISFLISLQLVRSEKKRFVVVVLKESVLEGNRSSSFVSIVVADLFSNLFSRLVVRYIFSKIGRK